MGRRKLEIKLIEAKSARQVTFSKRKNGLLKKARELSILCDLDIAVIINSSRGKLYHYCNNNTSLTEIVQRYHSHVESESSPSAGVCEAQAESSKYSGFLTCGDLLQIVERDLEEPCVDELTVTDLLQMENQIQAALIQAREAKTHLLLNSISSLHDEEKELVEEKRLLEAKIAGSKMDAPLIDLNVVPDHGETVV